METTDRELAWIQFQVMLLDAGAQVAEPEDEDR